MDAWMRRRKLLLLDLDNTLYDWVAYFAPALRGMCRALHELTGLPSATIWNDFKFVFSKHGTVEYSFALQELPSLISLHPDYTAAQLVAKYRSVVEIFQHRRRAYLRPYPGVIAGLETLRKLGFEVVGVTDSRRFQALNRLRQLHLDDHLDGLCCVADHSVPDTDTVATIRRFSDDYYRSQVRTVLQLPEGFRKPSPSVLDFVVSAFSIDYEACIYVGDSLSKDVSMAQSAGIYDCWAAYGARISALDFGTLVRVTDWPDYAVRDAMNPCPERLKIFPSFTAMSFETVVSLALMDPDDRPNRRRPKAEHRQLLFFEVGPSMAEHAK